MSLNRRSFLKGAIATGTASTLPLNALGAGRDEATQAVPSFRTAKADVYEGGWIKSLTVKETPTIPNMSSSLVEMKPGGVRGIHWHKTASEFGYVISGSCVLTVYDPNNHSESSVLNAGDIWFIPRGYAHGFWAAGQGGCRVCTVYDDGITTEQNALHLTDLLRHERPEILESVLGLPARTITAGAAKVSILAAGPVNPGLLSPHGYAGPPPQSFRFKMSMMPPVVTPGGTFVQASIENFPMSHTMVGAVTELTADGIREPHWHPNADEWDLVLEGRAIVTVFNGPGDVQAIEIGPDDLGFLPRNQSHAVETVGGKPFKLLSVFNANTFEAIGISELLAGLPNELIQHNFGLSPADVAKLPKDERFIVKNVRG